MMVSVTSLGRGLHVQWVDFYIDGTMWAYLADSDGRVTNVCFDGRPGSPTRNRLFQHARHPRKAGAVLVELGGPEEGIVVPLLSRWLDSAPPNALNLTEWGWEMARDTLLRLGEPGGARDPGER